MVACRERSTQGILLTSSTGSRPSNHAGTGRKSKARYRDHAGFRFQMCRRCWSDEAYHRISKDSVQVIRPNHLGIIMAKCLACNSGMDSCKCAA